MQAISAELLVELRSKLSSDFGWPDCQFRTVRRIDRLYSRIEEVEATPPGGRPMNIIVKIYLPCVGLSSEDLKRRICREYEILELLSRKMRDFPNLSVVTPLALFPQHMAIVSKKSPGQQFQKVLTTRARFYPAKTTLQRLERWSFTSGRWLHVFQEITRPEQSRNLDFSEISDNVGKRLNWLVDSPKIPLTAEIAEQVSTYLNDCAKKLEHTTVEISGTHGDFFPGNMLVHEDTVTVLDFATFSYNASLMDVTYFWHQLETLMLKPIYRPTVIARLQQNFLTGYSPDLAKDGVFQNRPLLKLFRILHLVRRLMGMIPEPSNFPIHKRISQMRMAKMTVKELNKLTRRTD